MPRDEELGRLNVDIDADSSGMKKGLNSAKSTLRKTVKSMQGIVSKLRTTLTGIGIVAVAAFARLSYGFLDQQKKMAILEHTYKSFAGAAGRSFKDIELGMLNLAKSTGISTADQAEALQVLMGKLDGFASEQEIMDVLLPIAIDWSVVSGKDVAEAAKDIAESYLGEPPEEIMMPVRVKFEEENPGQAFDDLTRQEKWQLIEQYLKKFEGSAEAAGDTIWGAFARIKVAIEEVFNAMADSADFAPFIDSIKDISDSLFDLAINIKNGESPDWLKEITDAIQRLMDSAEDFVKSGGLRDLIDNIGKILPHLPKLVAGLAGLTIAEKAAPAVGKLAGAIKWLAVVLGGSKIVDILFGLQNAFGALTVSLNPLKKALGYLLIPFGRFFGALSRGEGIIKAFIGFFSGIPTAIEFAAKAIGAPLAIAIATVVAFVAAWKNNWGQLVDRTKESLGNLLETFSGVWNNSLKPLLDSIVDLIVTFAELFYQPIKDLAGLLGIKLPEIKDLFSFLKDNVGNILKVMADGIGSTFAIIIESIEFFLKVAGGLIGIIVETIDNFVGLIDAILETLVAIFKGDFDEIDDIWGDWFKNLSKNGEDINQFLKNLLGDFVDWMGDLVANFMGFIGAWSDQADEFRQKTVDKFTDLSDKIRDWSSNVGDTFSNTLDNTKEWASNMGSKFKGFWDDTKTKLAGVFGTTVAYADDMSGEYDSINESTKTFASNMADKFTDFGNSTKEKLKTALDNTKAKFTDIKAAFSQHNIDIGDQASKLVAKYSTLKTDIANRIQEVKSSMRTKLSEMASTAKEGFENIASTIDNFTSTFLYVGRKLISKLWDGFLEIFRLIPGRVRGKISDVVESITNWKSSFKDAGKGLISSLWDGAKDKWSDFKRWMDSKLRTVRDFLPGSDAKFGPLSTLTDAGRGLFSAMQEGMAKQAPGFLKDVEGVVAKTRGIIPDTMNVTPGQLAYAGGSGSRQKQVVVQLNGGVYTNERDFDKLAQKVNENMNKQYRR